MSVIDDAPNQALAVIRSSLTLQTVEMTLNTRVFLGGAGTRRGPVIVSTERCGGVYPGAVRTVGYDIRGMMKGVIINVIFERWRGPCVGV